MERSALRRILSGIGGQVFVRSTIFINTLVILPILLVRWGAETYGEWLALSAIATYVSLSNFGLANASSTEMIIAIGTGDVSRAQKAFQTSFNFLLLISIPALLAIIGFASVFPINKTLNIHSVDETGAVVIVSLIAVTVWINTLKGLLAGAIATTGRYGLSNLISGNAKLVELAGLGIGVGLYGRHPVFAAYVVFGAALLDATGHVASIAVTTPWARPDFRVMDRGILRRLIPPSLGNFIIQLAVNSVSIQGPRLVLSAVIGPGAVAIYSVYGTAMRLADQITSLFASSLQLEVSTNVGAGNEAQPLRIVTAGTHAALLGFSAAAIGLLLFGKWFFRIWTHGVVEFHYALMLVFLSIGFMIQLGKLSQIYLVGTNKILRPALKVLMSELAGLVMGGLLVLPLGLIGMALGMVAAEATATSFLIVAAARLMKISPLHLLRRLFAMKDSYNEILVPLAQRALRRSRALRG